MRLGLDDGHLDLEQGEVVRGGSRVSLSGTEVKLLRYLADHPDRAVPQHELLEQVWGYAATARTRTVRTTVGRVRQKIEVDPREPRHLRTEHGEGYRLHAEVRPDPVPVHDDPCGSFVGRSDELAHLDAAAAAGRRLVTLLGPGGIGKTRLATAWSRQQSLPVTVIDAEPLHTGPELVEAAARRLGLSPGADLADRVGQALHARGPALWVVDNLEQIDDPGPVLAGWLARAPDLRLLTTSRRALDLRGEAVLEVGPLAHDDAVALLVERCASVRLDATPDPADPLLDRLATELDGMPLALELAAACTDVLPLSELVSRLGPTLLRDHGADRPTRHRSIAASLEGSWSLLDDGDRHALVAAAVFVRGARLADLEAVLDTPDALRAVRALRRAALLGLEGGRYRVLGVLATEVARRDPGAWRAAERAHRLHFATVARRIARDTFGPERDAALRTLADERGNLVAALRRTVTDDPDAAVQLALDLDPLASIDTGWPAELQRVATAAPHAVSLRVALASSLRRADRVAEAIQLLHTCLEEADRALHAPILEELARCCVISGRPDEAERHVTAAESAPLDARVAGRLARTRGKLLDRAGHSEAGLSHLERAAALSAEGGDRLEAALARADIGRMLLDLGRLDDARIALQRARGDLERESSQAALSTVLEPLAMAILPIDPQRAVALLHEAIAAARAGGHTRARLHAQWRLAGTWLDTGRTGEAETLLLELLPDAHDLGDPVFESTVYSDAGCVAIDRGDADAARQRFDRALELIAGDGPSIYAGWRWLHAGLAALRSGDPDRGRALLRRITAIPELRAAPGVWIAAHVLGEADPPEPPHDDSRLVLRLLRGDGTPADHRVAARSWLLRTVAALAPTAPDGRDRGGSQGRPPS